MKMISTNLVLLFLINYILLGQNSKISTKSYSTNSGFNDSTWVVKYIENFDSTFLAVDKKKFSEDDWLTFQILNGGKIEIDSGYAHIKTLDFWNVALIRSSKILPEEYKLRTKIGYVNYDLSNYETSDYTDYDFNTHSGNYENGVYFLTVTNDICEGNECIENWWHYHRKMVIDVDNHVNGIGQPDTYHPLYMVYMSPETNSIGNKLRTWDGNLWDTSPWNWNSSYTYEDDKWYFAELEKKNKQIILRFYDEDKNIIVETDPVDIDLVFAMDDSTEYFYAGEPHLDDYEGDFKIDEITLLIPEFPTNIANNSNPAIATNYVIHQNYPNPFNPTTTIRYTIPDNKVSSGSVSVKLTVYDMLGRTVETLVDANHKSGSYSVTWNATEQTSGIYFYHLQSDYFSGSGKMLLVK